MELEFFPPHPLLKSKHMKPALALGIAARERNYMYRLGTAWKLHASA